jgi:hypothetical protein
VADPTQAGNTCSGDGNQCFGSFVCDQSGICVGAQPVVCTAMDQCHVPGTCDPATGLCSNPNATDGTACNDSNQCTQGDSCQAGVCTGGTQVNCDDGNPCTTDSCDPALGCIYTAVDCDDGNPCTTDFCDQATGLCIHTPINCDDGLICTDDFCDPATGQCIHRPNTENCGPKQSCQEWLCGPGQDCVLVFHNDQCPSSGATCLAPICTIEGCTFTDTCGPTNPQCLGCADCTCNVTLNRCVPNCPT